MAFDKTKMIKLDNLSAPDTVTPENGLHYYSSADAGVTVKAAGYFNTWRKYLQVGDMILAKLAEGMKWYSVATVPGDGVSNVTVTDVSPIAGAGAGYRLARGQAITVTASDTIASGLASLVAVVATLNDAPVAGCQFVTADIGDQAGAPVAGSFLLKTWKATAAGDTTQIAATTFGKKVNWIAIGL